MDTLLKVLEEKTQLVIDKDLFAYEIPLKTIGVWVSDAPTDSRFNSVNVQEYDMYYRGKSKLSAIANLKYLKDTIDTLSTESCRLDDGTPFKLEILFNWEYIEKDSEGYFVFANRLRLFR